MNDDKWLGLPFYDRPLGSRADGTDDGRPVVMLTDFSTAQPAPHLGDALGQWSLIDYETERFTGRLLHAPRNRPAADVTLPLNLRGWYAVYVWVMGGDVDLEPAYPADFDSVYSQSPGPALKLTGDANFSRMFRTLSHDRMMWPGPECCFWKYADLTDQSLVVRHQGGTVYLAALQLVPLSPAEVEAVQAERGDAANRRLVVKGDVYNPGELAWRVEQLRHRGVAAWITGNEESADLSAPGGPVKLRAFRDACGEIGAECWVCDRPSLWSLHVHWRDARARWYEQHPQWHCRDRDGTPTHQMSYAVPEVVDYMLERLRASASEGIDGYGFFFNRDPGLVLFEEPALRGFEARHGVDPRTVPDRDDRLLDWRGDIITAFMRRVRQTLDEIAAQQRRPRIKLIAMTLGDRGANRFFSFDVERWVRERLVDVLMPYPWIDYPDRWLSQGFGGMDVKYFASLVRGTGCRLYPTWLSGPWRVGWTSEHVRMDEYFTRAMRDYADGADGISAWDEVGLDFAFKADRWLRLSQRERLASFVEHDFPLPPKLRFTKLGGTTPDRYPAGTGG